MTIETNRFFRIALAYMDSHPCPDEVKSVHCAILVRGGSIISIGINLPKRTGFTMAYSKHPNCSMHAELAAIAKVRNKIDLRGTKIYVARVRKSDNCFAMSMPCADCQRALVAYGVKKCIFTGNDGSLQHMSLGACNV